MNIHQIRTSLKKLNDLTDIEWEIVLDRERDNPTGLKLEDLDPYDFGQRYLIMSEPVDIKVMEELPDEFQSYVTYSNENGKNGFIIFDNSGRLSSVPPKIEDDAFSSQISSVELARLKNELRNISKIHPNLPIRVTPPKIIFLSDEKLVLYINDDEKFPVRVNNKRVKKVSPKTFFKSIVFPNTLSDSFIFKNNRIIIPSDTIPFLLDYLTNDFPLIYPTKNVAILKFFNYLRHTFDPDVVNIIYGGLYFKNKENFKENERITESLFRMFGDNVEIHVRDEKELITFTNINQLYLELWEQHVLDPLISLGLSDLLYDDIPVRPLHDIISEYVSDKDINEFQRENMERIEGIREQLGERIPVKEIQDLIELYSETFHI
jgi:hypothetical protein